MQHLMCFVPGWLALGAQYSDQRRDDRRIGFLSLKNWKLWNIYGKTMAKSMEKMEKSMEEMGNLRNIWKIYGKRGTETMEPPQIPWFMITCPTNNCHFTVIPCLYRCTPFSDAAIRHIFFYSQSIGETLRYFGLCSHAHSARVRNWNFTLTIYWLTNLHSPLLYNGLGHIPRYNTSYWNTFLNAQKGIISSVKASISGFDNFATSQLQCGWWFQGLNLIL